MSFKRDGDDPGQLSVLQKQRVADLLANYIPEDEALLLRSGRYACTVCAHRPIFDTLDVLAVHRAGKKHIASLQSFYGRKRSFENEVQKRQHEEFVRAEEAGTQGSPAPLLVRTRRIAQSALLKAAPYSSRCRRTGADRKSSKAGTTRMEPSAASARVTAMGQPEPGVSLQRGREAVDTTSAALLLGHRSRRAAHAPLRSPRRTKGSCRPDPAKRQRKSLAVTCKPARSPQPRETPGPGAVPAAPERWLDPGPLRQVGEG
ncbi:sodium channel modifier 1 isoform X2 [Rhea pennata]|uniref:sodium channel modifier 1 isoform X2 n=1 Tax=Rhea pennata TaxID=8795 RepID=UPI002E2633A3